MNTSIAADLRSDVVDFAADLIAIDTTNTGGAGTMGERVAAEYIADLLRQVGGRPEVLEASPGRTNVVLRIPGTGSAAAPEAGGVVVHGHLDVVPAHDADWSVDPFGGVIRDGYLWGRGAVDMKGTDAVMLTVARRWLTSGDRPERDVVFAWVADEEAGGTLGAQWLCREHADLFEGCGVALGEVGGFSIPIGRANLYPVMTAERAHAELTLTARGAGGHGSIGDAGNPINRLARVINRIADHRFPVIASDAVAGFLKAVGDLWHVDLTAMPLEQAISSIGPLGQLLTPVIRHSVQPTLLSAGQAANVVPVSASATLDCRMPPGHVDDFTEQIAELLADEVEFELRVLTNGMQSPFSGPVIDAITTSLLRHDPTARPLPYMVSASTDAAHFADHGLTTYGFSPLRLPQGFHFGAMFHGRDERVPVDGLEFGVAVLDDLLRSM